MKNISTTDKIWSFSYPAEATNHILGARWTMQIIHNLEVPKRFCELQAAVGDINPSTLTQRLEFLEKEGIIERISLSKLDHIGQYQLSRMGKHLLPIIQDLSRWAAAWLPIDENQAKNPTILKK
ncbi:MAG TPA: helix-turn-helix domain-containing protein [Anaerolineales bacterium]|jgi:DNA-binding HxlR family transcriptional regulator